MINVIGSLAGEKGYTDSVAYCTSKFGVVGLSEALLQELKETNTRLILINTWVVATPMTYTLFPDKSSKAISPYDIAKMILFFATEIGDTKYITVSLYGYQDFK